ncbi:RNA polymerase sigma factor FliA [Pseudonocardia nantongensis]|uniref:FliA/WhiG family RNA polymerase sigma factor n=1 Tax=Pseudonocardia nantongensis TaxID=1181885 RepID=UPI00397CDECB
MTRPTRGREAPTASRRRPEPFPSALASALDRNARGASELPQPGLAAVPEHAPGTGTGPVVAAPRHRSTSRPGGGGSGGSGGGVVRMALAPGAPAAAPDTPDPVHDHLIETVEVESRPLWRGFLQARGPVLRQRLVEHYAALVRGVGAKLAVRLPSSIELADLLQSGTFGLMEAVDRFDPVRGVRFEAYAAQRIRGAMLDELRAQDWVPRAVRARSREIERARETVLTRLGRPATDRELAGELGIGLRELRAATRPVHLVSSDELPEHGAIGVIAVATADTDPYQAAAGRETRGELRAAIGELGERDRLVLQLYYLEDHTLAEIGARLGVTESRVCQLHSRMLTRLRGRMEQALAG